MKKIIQINDTISIEIKRQPDRTTITLKDPKKVVLSNLKTSATFGSNVVYDENYIVVYSRGCMVNQIPLNIEAAYDIKEKRTLDLSNQKLKELLEYMLVCRKMFDLKEILTFINKEDLQILKEESKDRLKRTLTGGNYNITDEEVINYILSEYSVFSNYRNLKGPLTVLEYEEIEHKIGVTAFPLYIMPQSLKFIEQMNINEEPVLKRTKKPNK